MKNVHKLLGDTSVDYLIGIGKASWQPERSIKAAKGGDFWIWENQFGSCLGGSHPLIGRCIDRSDSLYTVLHAVMSSSVVEESKKIPSCSAYATKVSVTDVGDFFSLERLWNRNVVLVGVANVQYRDQGIRFVKRLS